MDTNNGDQRKIYNVIVERSYPDEDDNGFRQEHLLTVCATSNKAAKKIAIDYMQPKSPDANLLVLNVEESVIKDISVLLEQRL